ncbi:MAG: hypothetical protein [Malazfec virus 1]
MHLKIPFHPFNLYSYFNFYILIDWTGYATLSSFNKVLWYLASKFTGVSHFSPIG